MTTTYLFTGDSITDAGRREDRDRQLGSGYVRRLDERFQQAKLDITTINTGISGNRATDLLARWNDDVLEHAPRLLSIMVGVNDMWRRYDSDDPTTTEAFEQNYRALLEALNRDVTPTLVLIEPFLLPINDEQTTWRDDLDPKIDVVRELAREYDAVLVPADVELTRAAREHGAAAVADDGVHPTELGHRLLAGIWLDHVGIGR